MATLSRGVAVWVNLLVAVVVVGIVAAIFIPAAICGGPNRRNACLSNLKQLATSSLIYASDSDDRLPAARVWMDTIKPDVRNQAIYHCPWVANPSTEYGYAMNSGVAGLNTTTLAKPELAPLNYDSSNLARNASDPFSSLPTKPRHKRNNVAYADSHVRAVPAP